MNGHQYRYVVESNHLVNQLNAGETLLLGLANQIGVSSTADTQQVNINRHDELEVDSVFVNGSETDSMGERRRGDEKAKQVPYSLIG